MNNSFDLINIYFSFWLPHLDMSTIWMKNNSFVNKEIELPCYGSFEVNAHLQFLN